MAEPLLLPPHVEPTPAATSSEPKAFNAAEDAAALDAVPLQDYTSEFTQQASATNDASGGSSGTETGTGAPGPDAKPEDGPASSDAQASAKEFIELYDMGQAWGFHFYSQGMPAEKFELDKFPKDRAIHHLAKGLEKMGVVEVPWWIGLLLALTPPAFFNFMTAKGHREAQAAAATTAAKAKATTNQQAAARGEHIAPDTATTPAGKVIDLNAAKPATAPQQPKATKVYGNCGVCGTPLLKPHRKYCGKSCSGKASAGRKDAPALPALP